MLREIQQECGDLFHLHAPGKSIVVPFNPDDIRTIFQNDGKFPMKPGFEAFAFYRHRRRDMYQGNGE